ncbi:MAG TPA: PVC-type heme-binding CxxCH protein [Candidatus Limnocylindria bacterium]|nr:PVC-type heme-binding CxxCH protein [Candidatus Limnocylindria bacterium]
MRCTTGIVLGSALLSLGFTTLRAAEAPPADVVAHAGVSPTEACKFAILPPGFEMQVFAAEPDVVQPIAFCQDEKGRVWVAQNLCYPRRREEGKGLDSILCMEDTDGDGKADRITTVATNLNLVSGLEWGYGGLWVGAAPNLMFIPIADGPTPKLAGPPQILLDGWNYTADTHEVLNTFNWGPDGWLYGCHGVFCPSNVGKPGATEAERQWVDAAAWRFHPLAHRFEVFTEGGSNPWGIDFDEHGQLWAEMCVIPHLWHMVQGARLQRQGGEHYCVGPAEIARNAKFRDQRSHKPLFPYVYDDIGQVADHVHWAGGAGPHAANGRSDSVGGGHAHAGMMCYLGESWPASYRGKLFIGNIHGQRLNMDIPETKGSGYVGHHGADFLNFNDTWSQTLNQRYDQDGSVFVIDWYDRNQCHHTREDGHDRSNGRVYKIVYNHQKTTRVDLTKASDEQLVEWVPSKNEWYSRAARRLLQERVSKAHFANAGTAITAADSSRITKVNKALEKGFKRAKTTEAKIRYLWALHQINDFATLPNATSYLADKDEWVRSWAWQLGMESAPYRGNLEKDPFVMALADGAKDRSPVVRRFVSSALQRVPVAQRWSALENLVAHGEDVGDHNLPKMYWYAAEGCVASDPDRALNLLDRCKIPQVRQFIARRVAAGALAATN